MGTFDPEMSKVCQRGCATKLEYTEDMIVKQPGAKVGDLTRCPVSGVVFKITAESIHARYQGDEFFFCCGGCAKKFEEMPSHFVTLMCSTKS